MILKFSNIINTIHKISTYKSDIINYKFSLFFRLSEIC